MKNNYSLSIKSLKIASIGYLALPVILFFIFWLKPIFSLILISLFAYSFWKYFQSEAKSTKIEIPYWQIISLFLIVGIWVFISGAGGWGFQSPDLSKHSSIYKDIIQNGTPTSYQYNGKIIYLSAYLAYYIPIPLLFGWLSWPLMMFFVTIWTFLGALLGVIWFCILAESFSFWVVLFFILVGGLDVAGLIYNYGFSAAFDIIWNKFYETIPFFAIKIDPNMQLLYQTNTHSLFWGPQHALPCWIATGMFSYEWTKQKNILNSPIYLVLLPFWSPFMLLGLAPFVVYQVFNDSFKKYFSLQNLVLIPVFIVIIWFVNSVPVSNLEKGLIFYKPDRLLNYFSEIWAYVFFILFEVMVWAIPIYLILKKNQDKEKIFLLLLVCIILSIIPLYKLGKWNDFVQRVSMPSLFILWYFVANIWSKTKSIKFQLIFIFMLILGSWDSLQHILFSLKTTDYKIKYTAIPYEKVSNFVETSEKEKWPIEQSFAPDSASFFRYLTRKKIE
jgi:hypothetical protein